MRPISCRSISRLKSKMSRKKLRTNKKSQLRVKVKRWMKKWRN